MIHKTYKQLVEIIQSICENNPAINGFATGAFEKIDATYQNVQYPFMFLRPITSDGFITNQNNQVMGIRRTFELYSLELPQLTDSDYIELLSNCEQYLYDVIEDINNYDQQITVETTNLIPLNEAFNDRLVGWVTTIVVNDYGTASNC